MKKIIIFFSFILLAVTLMAQSPDLMSYQAVIRGADNNLLTEQSVGIRISILQGSENGTPVYQESQESITNVNGLLGLKIGEGSLLHGEFTGIDWTQGPYYLQTEIDTEGGTNYTLTITNQLLSVPYAKYADRAGESESKTSYMEFGSLNFSSETVNESWTTLGISSTKERSFTKNHDDTNVEVYFNSRVQAGTFTGTASFLMVAVRIDGEAPDYSGSGTIASSGNNEYLSFLSVFENLPAGTHTLQVVARTNRGSSENVVVDPGGLGGSIVVKEVK